MFLLSVPESIAFELTQRCDLACPHCYNVWKGKAGADYPTGELDTAALVALLRRAIAGLGPTRLVLTGGEPLLRGDLLEVVRAAAELAPWVTLVTHGGGITPALADGLAAHRNLNVQVTFLSARREVHDAIRGRPSFDRSLEGALALRERGVPVAFCFVCSRQSQDELGGVLDLAQALGVETISFNRMAPAGEGARHLATLAPTVEMIEQCLELLESATRVRRLRVTTAIPIPPCLISHERFPGIEFSFCSSASARPNPVVDTLGNVRSCNLSSVILGNLHRTSWRRILRSRHLRQLARVRPACCQPCSFATSCGGGCKEAALACHGSLAAEEPLLREREAPGPRACDGT